MRGGEAGWGRGEGGRRGGRGGTGARAVVKERDGSRRRETAEGLNRRVDLLAADVRRDITRLHTTLDKMEEMAEAQRASDVASARAAIEQSAWMLGGARVSDETVAAGQSATHSAVVVASLKRELAGTAQGFRDLLTEHATTMEHVGRRRARLGIGAPLVAADSAPTPSSSSSSSAASGAGAAAGGGGGDEEEGGFRDVSRDELMRQSMSSAAIAQADDQYAQQRLEGARDIQKHIEELSSAFQRLAGLVEAQKSTVDEIDNNVSNSLDMLEKGQRELEKSRAAAADPRWLMLRVGGVLMTFFLLYILFFA